MIAVIAKAPNTLLDAPVDESPQFPRHTVESEPVGIVDHLYLGCPRYCAISLGYCRRKAGTPIVVAGLAQLFVDSGAVKIS